MSTSSVSIGVSESSRRFPKLGCKSSPLPIALQFPVWKVNVCRLARELYIANIPADEIFYGTTDAGRNWLLSPLVPQPPGPLPELQGNNQAGFDAAMKAWKIKDDRFNAYWSAGYKAKNLIYTEMDEALQFQLDAQLGGAATALNATSTDTFNAAILLWAQATPADLFTLRAQLENPLLWTNTLSIRTHFADFNRSEQHLRANHYAMPVEELLNLAQRSIQTSAVASFYTQAIGNFHLSNPTPGSAGRTLAAFINQMVIANSLITEPPRAYAALAVNSPSITATAGAALLPPKPKVEKPPTLWCWTHGIGYHTSQNCRLPEPGHQVTATKANQMGSTMPKKNKKWNP